jgi:hypothetical protein
LRGAQQGDEVEKNRKKWVTAMRWDLDLFQWQVIKFGGLVVVVLIVFIHIVKLVKEAIAEIRKPHA